MCVKQHHFHLMFQHQPSLVCHVSETDLVVPSTCYIDKCCHLLNHARSKGKYHKFENSELKIKHFEHVTFRVPLCKYLSIVYKVWKKDESQVSNMYFSVHVIISYLYVFTFTSTINDVLDQQWESELYRSKY